MYFEIGGITDHDWGSLMKKKNKKKKHILTNWAVDKQIVTSMDNFVSVMLLYLRFHYKYIFTGVNIIYFSVKDVWNFLSSKF